MKNVRQNAMQPLPLFVLVVIELLYVRPTFARKLLSFSAPPQVLSKMVLTDRGILLSLYGSTGGSECDHLNRVVKLLKSKSNLRGILVIDEDRNENWV